jgi:serine/threonine protein kinase
MTFLYDLLYYSSTKLMCSIAACAMQCCVTRRVVIYEQHRSFVLLFIQCSTVLIVSVLVNMLLLQYMERGSLRKILNASFSWQEFTPSMRHQILADIAEGMQYLHEQQVFHRDLKRSVPVSHYTRICHYT